MSATLLFGKPVAREILKSLQPRVVACKEAGVTPHLAILLVGDDKPSKRYVEKKRRAARYVGIEFTLRYLPETSTTEDCIREIQDLQESVDPSGIIVQLPLPAHVDQQAVLDAVDVARDVDCLTTENGELLGTEETRFEPPTPLSILTLLEKAGVHDVSGKTIAVVGTGALVGGPLIKMLEARGATVLACNKETVDIPGQTTQADILVSGVGKADLIRGEMIKPGAIVLDAGISFLPDGTVVGDVNIDEAVEVASAVTPTPNGVGPVTVAHLLQNTVIAAERRVT